ncbi:hypothetical protein BH10BDE1_BH10BDE1_20350 [soil metagenome]
MNREEISNSSDSKLMMRVRVAITASAVAFAAGLMMSCAPKGSIGQAKAPGAYDHLDADEKLAMSDVLADEAEEKLGFATLNEAWGGFNESLQLNPNNVRSQFWRVALKPVLDTRGIIARVRPLYMKQDHGVERYSKLRKGIDQSANAGYRSFYTEGAQDIDTDEKLREWMDIQISSLESLRNFLKANKDQTFTMRAPIEFVAGLWTNGRADKCSALKSINPKFSGCPETGMMKFKMNRADLEAFQYVVATYTVQLSLMSAYNLNPVVMFDDTQHSLKPKTRIENMLKNYDGGILQKNRLALALSVVPDAVISVRYFVNNQEELCRKDRYENRANRPGYLLAWTACMFDRGEAEGTKLLETLESLLNGQPVKIDLGGLNKEVSVYPLKFLKSPPANITAFAPTKFDADGEYEAFNESTYSPYFANGTINDVIGAQREENERNRIWYQRYMESQNQAPVAAPVTKEEKK